MSRKFVFDEEFRSDDSKLVARSLSTVEKIKGVDRRLQFQEVDRWIMSGRLMRIKLDYLLWFHFSEIDSTVKKAGKRVFDLVVNDKNVSRVDVFNEVGGFAAFSLNYTVKNLSSTTVKVKLSPVSGEPIISGLENYAIVPADMATVPEQMSAMKALKGWNGDPCAPTSWNAWIHVNLSSNSLSGS